MASALDEAASLLRTRLRELDGERKKLERALANLTGGRLGRRGQGRPPGSGRKAAAPRRRRSGTRADQAVRLILQSCVAGVRASDAVAVVAEVPAGSGQSPSPATPDAKRRMSPELFLR